MGSRWGRPDGLLSRPVKLALFPRKAFSFCPTSIPSHYLRSLLHLHLLFFHTTLTWLIIALTLLTDTRRSLKSFFSMLEE